jgi:hypothetical protein
MILPKMGDARVVGKSCDLWWVGKQRISPHKRVREHQQQQQQQQHLLS